MNVITIPTSEEIAERRIPIPPTQSAFYKDNEEVFNKKRISNENVATLIASWLFGYDGFDFKSDDPQELNYRILETIINRYPKTVYQDKKDKEYLDDLRNYNVAGV